MILLPYPTSPKSRFGGGLGWGSTFRNLDLILRQPEPSPHCPILEGARDQLGFDVILEGYLGSGDPKGTMCFAEEHQARW
ncbi:MAG: hypothetical protein A2X25_00375 [Chloroflexi bacterium GWB2_49_20]|nr:MAG: hypothetical protein A2X25_00375 [Chloroflexi bacterium GWB2_49_20]OGN79128.1 MAG: hypothetical protein A2X26_06225 [Chloroflexi bacterium GWC2_49_37]OGN84924.1 MAG: hypothetical protein A2X27_15265 [Chloroflexi bacterium GWD2_49_16]HCC78014.1 hypothetical protein [Anaerolineae bacterium]